VEKVACNRTESLEMDEGKMGIDGNRRDWNNSCNRWKSEEIARYLYNR
jgi:hypothetical protein